MRACRSACPSLNCATPGSSSIELGVAVTVAATLTSIYDDLVGEPLGPLAGNFDDATEVTEADQVEGPEWDAEPGDG
jgi:hypothetical protein